MGVPGEQLEDVFGPVRDQFLVIFMNALRQARQSTPSLQIEPIRKDQDQEIGRAGRLNLPMRDDCVLDSTYAPSLLRIPAIKPVHRGPMRFNIEGGLTCDVLPFVWNDVWLCVEPRCDSGLLMRLRLWFLDWFQSRNVDGVRDVQGVLHWLEGPYEFKEQHWFQADLGTAPVDALLSLIELFKAGHAKSFQIGGAPEFAGS